LDGRLDIGLSLFAPLLAESSLDIGEVAVYIVVDIVDGTFAAPGRTGGTGRWATWIAWAIHDVGAS